MASMSGTLSWLPLDLGGSNSSLQVLQLDGIEYKDIRFPNGDGYKGGWREGQPEGEGRYVWADGAVYEGSWQSGQKQGWGKYIWPGGAAYLGEWRSGLLQGYGTFQAPDGSRYQGTWVGSIKQGIGTKWYGNGDRYEGLWREGKANGPGRYVWAAGNEYDGEWRDGKMHGQGTLKWQAGQRYDGEWRDGQEDGIGVSTWADGSTFEGFWSSGRKHGVGVFRPAPGKAHAHGAALRPSFDAPGERGRRESEYSSSVDATAAGGPVEVAGDDPIGSPSAARGPRPADAALAELRGEAEVVFVCEYEDGGLVHREALSPADLELVFGPAAKQAERGNRLRRPGRLRRRREDRMGETIFKGHRSFDLMLNLQLGIRYTLGAVSKLPSPQALAPGHFEEKVWLRFPRAGSEVTPPHPSNDFKWKDYCPTVFRALREVFGITNSEYILSTCGDQALRELPSPGKSGSVFFVSHDQRFIIKTMRKEEVKLLLSALPRYHAHVSAHPDTLLARFYGVHRLRPAHGAKVRFVVMNNIFRCDLPLHRKYDLKGSTYKRTAGERPAAAAVRKDLDLDVVFRLEPRTRERLVRQLAADAAFLEATSVMDYSLLLGVHCRALGEASATPHNTDKEDDDGRYTSAQEEGDFGSFGRDLSQRLNSHLHQQHAAAMPSSAAGALLGPDSSSAAVGSAGEQESEAASSALPSVDLDYELTRSMHATTLKEATAAPTEAAPRGSFGFRSFLAWRKQQKEKQRQLKEQRQAPMQRADAGTGSSGLTPRVAPTLVLPRAAAAVPPPQAHLGSSSGGAPSEHAAAQATGPLLPAPPAAPPPPQASRTPSTPGASVAGTPTVRSMVRQQQQQQQQQEEKVAPPRVTLSQRLTEQHAALVATLGHVAGGSEAGAASLSDNAGGLTWRAAAAALPEAPSSVRHPAAASRQDGTAHARQLSFNLAAAMTPHGSASTSSSEAASPVSASPVWPPGTLRRSPFSGTPGGSEALERMSSFTNGSGAVFPQAAMERATSAPPAGLQGLAILEPGDGMIENELAHFALRSDPSVVDFSAPGVAAMASRISTKLARPIGDRLLHDLLRLAQYKILAPAATRGSRVPTAVLAARRARAGGEARQSLDEEAAAALAAGLLPGEVPSRLGHQVSAIAVPAVPDAGEAVGEEVVLFMGLIDWLQPYNMRKKLEHSFKAVVQDAHAISVVEPKAYAARFLGFMDRVFTAGGKKRSSQPE